MATKTYKTALLITGDASGAVRATEVTDKQLKKLGATQTRGIGIAANYAKSALNVSRQLQNYATIAGGVALVATGALVRTQLQAIDSSAKLADRVNVSTQALSGLHFITELNGESTESLDKSLEKMVRSLGEAERGIGTAKPALKELNIDIDEMSKLPADEQFIRIAGAISEVDTTARQASLASDIFGRSGIKLLNTFNQGEEAIRAARQEVEDIGAAFTRVDAAKVEKANDQLLRAGKVTDGIAQSITIKVAPIIDDLATRFINAAKEAGGMGPVIDDVFGDAIVVLGWFADGIHGLEVLWKGLSLAVQAFGVTTINGLEAQIKLVYELANLLPGVDLSYKNSTFGKFSKEMNADYAKAKSELHELMLEPLPSDALKDYVVEVAESAEAAAIAATDGSKNIIDDSADGFEDLTSEVTNLLDELLPLEKATKDFNKDMASLNQLLDKGELSAARFAVAQANLNKKHKDLFPELQKTKDAAKAMETAWTRSVERMDDAFFDFFRSGLEGFDSFKDAALNIVKDLIAQILLNFAKVQLLNIGVNASASGLATSAATSAGAQAAGNAGFGAIGALATSGFGALSQNLAKVLPTGFGGTVGFAKATPETLMQLGGDGLTVDLGTSAAAQPGIDFKQLGLGIVAAAVGSVVGTKLGGELFDREARSAAGATIGAAIGSIWGPIGTFIGSTLGGLVDSLFGGKVKDPRFSIGATSLEERESFDREDITKITSSSFGNVRFQSDKDLFAGATQEQADQLFTLFDGIASLEDAIASTLGNSQVEEITAAVKEQELLYKKNSADFSGFFKDRFRIIFDTIGGAAADAFEQMTAGLTDDQILESIDVISDASIIVGQAEGSLKQYFDSLSKITLELVQGGVVLDSANQLLKGIGSDLLPLTEQGARAATSLVELAGGLENFSQLTAQLGGFLLTEAEQLDLLEASLADVFETMNLALPKTKDGFEDILNGLDLSIESQRANYIGLLTLVPQLDALFNSLESDASDAIVTVSRSVATLQNSVRSLTGQLFGTVEDGINNAISAEQTRISEIAQAERELHAEQLQRYNDAIAAERSLADAVDSNLFGDLSILKPLDKVAAAQSKFNELFNRGQGGDAAAAQEAAQFSSVYLQIAREAEASSDQFNNRFRDVNQKLGQLSGIFGNVSDPGAGNFTSTSPQLLALFEQQTQLQQRLVDAEEKDIAQELFEKLSELSLATDESISSLAESFGFSISDLGDKLGQDLTEVVQSVDQSSVVVSDSNFQAADVIEDSIGSLHEDNVATKAVVDNSMSNILSGIASIDLSGLYSINSINSDISAQIAAAIAALNSTAQPVVTPSVPAPVIVPSIPVVTPSVPAPVIAPNIPTLSTGDNPGPIYDSPVQYPLPSPTNPFVAPVLSSVSSSTQQTETVEILTEKLEAVVAEIQTLTETVQEQTRTEIAIGETTSKVIALTSEEVAQIQRDLLDEFKFPTNFNFGGF